MLWQAVIFGPEVWGGREGDGVTLCDDDHTHTRMHRIPAFGRADRIPFIRFAVADRAWGHPFGRAYRTARTGVMCHSVF